MSRTGGKLPENRILYVKNLSFKTRGEDLYDLFGKYGSVRQIRVGTEAKTKGTAFVVFEEAQDVRSVIGTPYHDSPSPFAGQDRIRALERISLARALSRRSVYCYDSTPSR